MIVNWRQRIETEAPDWNVTLERYTILPMFIILKTVNCDFNLCDKNIILKNNKPGLKSNLNSY